MAAIKFSQESDYDGSKDPLVPKVIETPASCHAEEHAEYPGEVVVWGEHHPMVSLGRRSGGEAYRHEPPQPSLCPHIPY